MSVTDLAPRAIPIEDVGPLIGCKRSKVFQLVRDGKLKARRLGGSTVVLPADLDAYVAGLPDVRDAPYHLCGLKLARLRQQQQTG